MGTIKKGILGGFSGKVGTVVGSSWKGIAYMKSLPLSVKNPRTEAQVSNRAKFLLVQSTLQSMSELLRTGWKLYAQHQSPFNAATAYTFAKAVSGFLYQLGLPSKVSYTIVSLAVSSFVLTTLDTVARLGRLSFQELFSIENKNDSSGSLISRALKSKTAASICTLGPAYLLAVTGYQSIWALFGAANQLLAALTLIACTMFFKKTKRRIIMLLIPTIIMLAVTYSSLVISIKDRVVILINGHMHIPVLEMQIVIAAMLLVLGIMVVVACAAKLLEKDPVNEKNSLVVTK